MIPLRIWHIGVAVALAVSGYVAYWLVAADRLRAGLEDWAAQRRAAGDQVDWHSLEVSGFPFRLVATIEQPSLGLPARPERPSWSAERVVAVVQPWNFRHVLVNLDGRHLLSLVDADGERRLGARLGDAWASYLGGADGRAELLSFDAKAVEAWDSRQPGHVTADHVEMHGRPSASGSGIVDLAGDAERLVLPESPGNGFGRTVEQVGADLTITGEVPPAGSPPEMVAAWRDGGGTVELRRFSATWDGVRIDGSGTLALDGENRPLGALTARLRGHEKLLDRLAAGGLIAADKLPTAKALLGVLAGANGGVLSVPVDMQDGKLFLGPVLLARLNPVLATVDRSPAPASPDQRR